MKKFLNKFLIVAAGFFLFSACKKDDSIETFKGGTPPSLSSSVTGDIPLAYASASENAITLNWTNPEYQFASGVSSQDVNYLIEIDTAGANFSNPARQQVSVSKDLALSVSQGQFNDWLLNQLVLTPGIVHTLEIRITSTISGSKATALTSNVLSFSATPYAIPPKVKPPVNGELFITGDATASGWANPVPVPSQQFTELSPTLFEITVPLVGGKEYLCIPVNGDWSHKYSVKDKTLPGLSDGGDFLYDANDNFPGPATSGTYKITVDFQRGKFVVVKQ